MSAWPDGYGDLADDAVHAYLMLATTTAAGAPLVSPIWFVADGGGARLLICCAPDSLKARHVAARPAVAGAVLAEGELGRYVHVRGRARLAPELDRDAVYQRIVRRYSGPDAVGGAGDTQVVVAIEVEHATGFDYRSWEA